jgi:hypothetical protein
MFSVSRATPVRVADILNLFQYVRRRLNRRLTNLVHAGRMVGILQVDRRFNVSGITQLLVLANLNFELAVPRRRILCLLGSSAPKPQP